MQTTYQKQNEKITETTIRQEVTEAYFAVLLWKEKLKLSEENIKQAKEVYNTSKNLQSLGQAIEYDVMRNEIDLENAKASNEQNTKNYKLAISDFLYKLGTDTIKNLVLKDSITNLALEYSSNLPGINETERTELLQQKIQIVINDQNIRKQTMLWIPTLSVYANYSFQNLNNKFTPFNSNNEFPYNYAGVKASFPIFDGGLKIKTRQEYILRSEAAKFQYNKLESDFRQEINSTQTTLDNSLSDLNYQMKNLALIEDLYKIDTERFKNGTIRQSDLTTTYYTLQQTQTNYINTVYNYLVAVVRYKKAVGSL